MRHKPIVGPDAPALRGSRSAQTSHLRPIASHLQTGPDGSGGAKQVRKQLDLVLADTKLLGVPEHMVANAALSWAAERVYMQGGYASVRAAMLDALETILIMDAGDKDAA